MSMLQALIVAFQMKVAQISDKDRGATATEYALLVGLIAVAIVTAVALFGTDLSKFFNTIATDVSNWSSGTK